MTEKILPHIMEKAEIKIVGRQSTERRVIASSVGALAIKILEENRLKGTVIEIPSLGLTINGAHGLAQPK